MSSILLEITQNDINHEVSWIIAASTMEQVSAASLTEGTNDIDSELISIAALHHVRFTKIS